MVPAPGGPWGKPPGRGSWISPAVWLGLGLAAVLGLAALLVVLFPEAMATDRAWLRLTYLVLLASVLLVFLIGRRHWEGRRALRHGGIWLGVLLVLLLGYSYRRELGEVLARVAGEVLPHQGTATGDGAIAFPVARDGHFRVEAMVEGVAIRFLVDTGASHVTLTRRDAERLGYRVDRLAFTLRYATANGIVRGAPITLRSIEVGPIRLRDVTASVSEGELDRSLLGMSFLGRLGAFEVRDDTLILRP